jgi:twitching motility protein PilT
MNAVQTARFEETREVDLAYGIAGLGRFRVNVFQQRGTVGIVFRVIPFGVKSIEQLHLPKVIESIAMEQRGLVLVTGTTGSGKSTSLAAMIDYINTNRTCHIMTIEDPIEFLIRDRRSIVNQREIGVDTQSFANALRAALRQDPDVILVGEMRDSETISMAMTAAETGHLVLGTLHTTSATKTIDRIIDALPIEEREQTKSFLSQSLLAVITQALVKRPEGRGRRAICEVMVMNRAIAKLIQTDQTHQIPAQLQTGKDQGMQLLDQALLAAVKAKEVDPDDAYTIATDKKALSKFVVDRSLLPQFDI